MLTKSAGKVAAKNAMELMGYVVTVKGGWVVNLLSAQITSQLRLRVFAGPNVSNHNT